MLANKFDSIYIKKFDKNEFNKTYKSASSILFKKNEKNEYVYEFYLKLLFDSLNNIEKINFIKVANDYLNLSPVYVWVKLNEDKIKEYYEKNKNAIKLEDTIQNQLRISIGAFWGWVMTNEKSIRWGKRYVKKNKKHNINSNNKNINYAFGFKTAALFEC